MSLATFRFQLENGSGFILLENASGYLVQEAQPAVTVVKATQQGFYNGIFRDIGDIFALITPEDFSDSTVSMVPVGNPDYPLYGWMLLVPSSTPLYSYALQGTSGQGGSDAPVAAQGANSAGQRVLGNYKRYVV